MDTEDELYTDVFIVLYLVEGICSNRNIWCSSVLCIDAKYVCLMRRRSLHTFSGREDYTVAWELPCPAYQPTVCQKRQFAQGQCLYYQVRI